MTQASQSLDEFGFVSRGKSRHRPRDAAHLYGGPHPFIQTGDVKHSNLYITNYTQTYSDAGLAQSKMWPAGTLCITIAANIADTAILAFEACFPDSIIGFIPNERKADARFIKYLFDFSLQSRFKVFTQGVAQDNLSQSKLLSLKFLVPDINKQKHIADVLSTYDNLIGNNHRRIVLLEQAARLLYQEWFVRFRFPGHEHIRMSGGIPKGWSRKQVGDSVEFLSRGITPKYDEEASGIVINQKCIRNRLVVLELARKQSKEVPLDKLVKLGDVLINSTGEGTLGRVSQFTYTLPNCTVDSHITIARPKIAIPRFYFGMFMTGLETYLSSKGRGATNQTELARSTISEIAFILPSKGLTDIFEEITSNIYEQITTLSDFNSKLIKAHDLLLPRLMSGEIAV